MSPSIAPVEPVQKITPARTKVLCVDDEPMVLEGLTLHLGRRYEVFTATSGELGLATLEEHPDCAVVLSDMRMPGMDGATFLAEARHRVPDATRMLLTGQTDMSGAAAVVNRGQVFRFLTKPCPAPELIEAFAAAIEHHHLVTAERVLLRETLFGSIHALSELMAVLAPDSVGRASRVQRLVTEVARRLGWEERWQVELAAMLSQAARTTLPAALLAKRGRGEALDDAERQVFDEAPLVAARLVGHVPRIDEVRQILLALRSPKAGLVAMPPAVKRGVELLRAVEDYVDLCWGGDSTDVALATLASSHARCPEEILDALKQVELDHAVDTEVVELAVAALRPGMIVLDDIRFASGVLLVPKGAEITRGFIEHARYFHPGSVTPTVRVKMKRAAAAS